MQPSYLSIAALVLLTLLAGSGWAAHLDHDRTQADAPAFAVTMHAAEIALESSASGTTPERSESLNRVGPTLDPSAAETQAVGYAEKLYILLCTYRI